ncbi:MAG: hypothetical protein WCK10_02800 [Candidatus Staskawiczbacteria bacterium]
MEDEKNKILKEIIYKLTNEYSLIPEEEEIVEEIVEEKRYKEKDV